MAPVGDLRRLLRDLLLRTALLATAWSLCAAHAAAGGRVLLAGPDWQPRTELSALLRPGGKESPLLLVLARGDAPACAWPGWRSETATLADLPEGGADEEQERALAERIGRADALLLDGGSWLAWWQRCLPRKQPGRILRALQEARSRGVLVCARGDAARFVGGGLVLPDETGREMKNRQAQERAWIVAGHLLATPLCIEYEDAADHGAGRVFDAVARELRTAGTRELERAFVVARDGALLVDDEAGALAALDRAALRLGFEHLRKLGADRMDQIALDVLAPARIDAGLLASARTERWHEWSKPCAAPGSSSPCDAPSTDMALATLLDALASGDAARHADRQGELLRAKGSRSASWTRRAAR